MLCYTIFPDLSRGQRKIFQKNDPTDFPWDQITGSALEFSVGDLIGNTAQPLCVRCKVSFFVRVHKFDAGGLTPGKENLCAMTEKMQTDDVQRR